MFADVAAEAVVVAVVVVVELQALKWCTTVGS